jgi:uncharacterized membrane protein AbrB (regulator of aidB expression)
MRAVIKRLTDRWVLVLVVLIVLVLVLIEAGFLLAR